MVVVLVLVMVFVLVILLGYSDIVINVVDISIIL